MSTKSRRKPRNPSKMYIGRYILAGSPVVVYLDPAVGDSCVREGWTQGSYLTMTVSGSDELWPMVLDGLLHETLELAMLLLGHSYAPYTLLRQDSADRFVFSFNHPQFTRICREAADFLASVVPDLQKAWTASRKES